MKYISKHKLRRAIISKIKENSIAYKEAKSKAEMSLYEGYNWGLHYVIALLDLGKFNYRRGKHK